MTALATPPDDARKLDYFTRKIANFVHSTRTAQDHDDGVCAARAGA